MKQGTDNHGSSSTPAAAAAGSVMVRSSSLGEHVAGLPERATASTPVVRNVLSPCQESLKLEWAFGLHKDFKSTIHNLSSTSSSTSFAGGKGVSPSRSSLSRSAATSSIAASTSLQQQQQSGQEQRKVFYPLAHVGVIYDAINNTQRHLVGHAHTIVASCCSYNKRFIVTADEGDRKLWALREQHDKAVSVQVNSNNNDDEEDLAAAAEEEAHLMLDPHEACRPEEDDGSLMIVWDTHTGLPVRTIPVGQYGGVLCCALSPDGTYIATINRRVPQELMIWGWTADSADATATMRSNYRTNTQGTEYEAAAAAEENGGAAVMVTAPELVRRMPAQDEQTCVRFSADSPQLLCSNGLRRVFFWSWEEGVLKYYSPPILQSELKTPVGHLTQTILIPGTTMACSGTVDGDVVLWELQPRDRVVKVQDKLLLKTVRVHTGGVSFLTHENGYIVTGGMDGHVKFLDLKLRLVAWFEELNGGPIISISFDKPPSTTSAEEAAATNEARTRQHLQYAGTNAPLQFDCPDFMVSTAHAMIIDVPARSFVLGKRNALVRGKLLVQGQDQALQCLAAHPLLSRVAIAGLSGNVHLWDYEQKRVLVLSLFRNLLVQCMAFDPSGTYLAVGFTNGQLKLLDAETLEEKQGFKPKRTDSVLRICFSQDSRMMATGTSGGCVGLYEYTHRHHNVSKPMEWEFVGHHRTHRAPICGIQFQHNTQNEVVRLVSVGEDKKVVEYNLVESDVESGLLLRTAHKITQGALPTGFLWTKQPAVLDAMSRPRPTVVPQSSHHHSSSTNTNTTSNTPVGRGEDKGEGGGATDYFIIATDEYKLNVYLSDWDRQCVKTVLGPTFGGPITEMAIVPCGGGAGSHAEQPSAEASSAGNAPPGQPCMVYATREKVIGLVQLPLRGDPCASMGLLAHPGRILSIAVSHDGAYVFTTGGEDQSMMQWRVDGSHIMPQQQQPMQQQQQQTQPRVLQDTTSAAAAAALAHNTKDDGGVPLDHLLAVIDGGPEGDFMWEIVDYFYYAQIRAQGEETTAKRELLGAIHFSQLPHLMRALGYYPSELEIGHMAYEVANMYGPREVPLADMDVDAILLSFSQFMRLYVNYRPVFGITRNDIEAAFRALGADPTTGQLSRDTFFQLLGAKGEPLRTAEVAAALASLLGTGVRVEMLENVITARSFAEHLLGFEDYDDSSNNNNGETGQREGGADGKANGGHGLDESSSEEDDDGEQSVVYGDGEGDLVLM